MKSTAKGKIPVGKTKSLTFSVANKNKKNIINIQIIIRDFVSINRLIQNENENNTKLWRDKFKNLKNVKKFKKLFGVLKKLIFLFSAWGGILHKFMQNPPPRGGDTA